MSLGWGEGEYRRKLIEQAAPRPESKGFVGAFDPLTGEYKWRHRLKSVFNGGVLATTTGLLFQGEGQTGFVVRDTDTGEPIWHFDTPGSFNSSVISYQIGSTQYVATMINGNRVIDLGGTLLVFKLDGEESLDVAEIVESDVPEQPEVEYSYEKYVQGDELYHAQCSSCHGGIGIPSEVATVAPDLRLMTLETHGEYEAIVLGGSRSEQGMAGFADALGVEEIETIRVFIVNQANGLRQWQEERKSQVEVGAEL